MQCTLEGPFEDFPPMAAAYTFSVPEKSLGAVLLCTYVSILNKYLLCMIRYNTLI